MRRPALRALATAAVILLATVAAILHALSVPAVRPASAPADAFSGERAMDHVREIARAPHAVGSAGHARVRDYLMSELSRIGVPAEVQATTGIGTRYQAAGRVQNVLARLPGEEPGPAVLLMAHYDAVPVSPGAGDDGSGTATLLETLRALRSGPRLRHDVIALFADGEEAGLLGAAAFVREHPWAKDVAVTMNVEARGTRGPSLMFETGKGNLDVARVLRGAGGARATSLSTAVYRRLPNDTDLSELMLLDQPALNFAFIGGVDRYHTAEDDVAHLDARSVQHHGDQVLALTRVFASEPLPRPKTGDAVFFDLPLVGLVVYPESLALPLAVLAIALVIAGVALVRRRETKWVRGLTAGLVATFAAAVLALLAALGVVKTLAAAHTAIGSGRIDLSGVYVAAVALLAFAVAAAAYRLARRWAEPRGLQAGALAAWAILSLLVAFSLPGGSFLFTWPLLFMATAFVLVQLRPGVAFGIWTHGIAGVIAILIVAPITYLMGSVALGLTQGAGVVALLTALTAWLLASAFALMVNESWWPATAAAAGAVALFGIGLATVRTDADHPVGTTFGYGIDADSGGAWITGDAQSGAAALWVRAELGRMMPGGSLDRGPVWLGRGFSSSPAIRVPEVPANPAEVRVLSDSTTDSSRVVTLRIVPPRGALAISMRADSVRRARVDGLEVDPSGYRSRSRRWSLEYVAPDPAGFTIELAIPAGVAMELEVLSRRPGLPDIPGLGLPQRPEGVLPVQRGDVTLVYRRVRL